MLADNYFRATLLPQKVGKLYQNQYYNLYLCWHTSRSELLPYLLITKFQLDTSIRKILNDYLQGKVTENSRIILNTYEQLTQEDDPQNHSEGNSISKINNTGDKRKQEENWQDVSQDDSGHNEDGQG